MKKLILCLILLVAIIIPLACGNSNNAPSPTSPLNGGGTISTPTRTPTITPTPGGPTNTPTPTFTLPAGVNTPTSTPTFSVPTPIYENTYPTFASPNGMVISGNIMTLAEYPDNGKGGAEGLETFDLGSGGVTTNGTGNFPGETAYLYGGAPPTPGSTPAWAPTTYTLAGPQGFINPGGTAGYAAVLDTDNGGATLYCGNSQNMSTAWNFEYSNTPVPEYLYDSYEPLFTNGYGGIAFKSPKGMTGDSLGDIYVADTGNGAVEEFNGYTYYNTLSNNEIDMLHSTNGNGGITFVNTTVPAAPITFVSVNFKSPYAITIDSTNNDIWVTDTGYSPSVVQEYSFQGGVSILAAWQTIPKCVATGIAIAPTGSPDAGDVYVADSGNNMVEIYNAMGTLLSELTDPHSLYEGGYSFTPSCIGFNGSSSTYDVWVGDTSNDYIISFKPQ